MSEVERSNAECHPVLALNQALNPENAAKVAELVMENLRLAKEVKQYRAKEAVLVGFIQAGRAACICQQTEPDSCSWCAKVDPLLTSLPQASLQTTISDQDPEKLRAEGAEAERARILKLIENFEGRGIMKTAPGMPSQLTHDTGDWQHLYWEIEEPRETLESLSQDTRKD
jgi:hypothetical protein